MVTQELLERVRTNSECSLDELWKVVLESRKTPISHRVTSSGKEIDLIEYRSYFDCTVKAGGKMYEVPYLTFLLWDFDTGMKAVKVRDIKVGLPKIRNDISAVVLRVHNTTADILTSKGVLVLNWNKDSFRYSKLCSCRLGTFDLDRKQVIDMSAVTRRITISHNGVDGLMMLKDVQHEVIDFTEDISTIKVRRGKLTGWFEQDVIREHILKKKPIPVQDFTDYGGISFICNADSSVIIDETYRYLRRLNELESTLALICTRGVTHALELGLIEELEEKPEPVTQMYTLDFDLRLGNRYILEDGLEVLLLRISDDNVTVVTKEGCVKEVSRDKIHEGGI